MVVFPPGEGKRLWSLATTPSLHSVAFAADMTPSGPALGRIFVVMVVSTPPFNEVPSRKFPFPVAVWDTHIGLPSPRSAQQLFQLLPEG